MPEEKVISSWEEIADEATPVTSWDETEVPVKKKDGTQLSTNGSVKSDVSQSKSNSNWNSVLPSVKKPQFGNFPNTNNGVLGKGTTVAEKTTKQQPVNNPYDVSGATKQTSDNTDSGLPNPAKTIETQRKAQELQQIKADRDAANPNSFQNIGASYKTKASKLAGNNDVEKMLNYGDINGNSKFVIDLLDEDDKDLYTTKVGIEDIAKTNAMYDKQLKSGAISQDQYDAIKKNNDKLLIDLNIDYTQKLKKRNGDIDEQIAEAQSKLANGVYIPEIGSYQQLGAKELQAEKDKIKYLTGIKNDVLIDINNPVKSLQKHEGFQQAEKEGLIPSNATNTQKIKIYSNILVDKVKKLAGELGYDASDAQSLLGNNFMDANGRKMMFESLKSLVVGTNDKEKDFIHTMAELQAIAPIAALNKNNLTLNEGYTSNIVSSFRKSVAPMFTKNQIATDQDRNALTSEAFGEAGINNVNPSYSSKQQATEDESKTLGKTVARTAGDVLGIGVKIGIINPILELPGAAIEMATGVPIFKGINKALSTSKEAQAVEGAALSSASAAAKTAGEAKQIADAQKVLDIAKVVSDKIPNNFLTRTIYNTTKAGTVHEIQGNLNKDLEGFANFGVGAVNSLIGIPINALGNVAVKMFGKDAPAFVARTIDALKAGTSMTATMAGMTGVNAAREAESFDAFKETLDEHFGTNDKRLRFVAENFLLGLALHAGNVGNLSNLFKSNYENQYKELSDPEKEKLNEFTEDVNNEVNNFETATKEAVEVVQDENHMPLTTEKEAKDQVEEFLKPIENEQQTTTNVEQKPVNNDSSRLSETSADNKTDGTISKTELSNEVEVPTVDQKFEEKLKSLNIPERQKAILAEADANPKSYVHNYYDINQLREDVGYSEKKYKEGGYGTKYRTPEPVKPLLEMNSDELNEYAKQLRQHEKNLKLSNDEFNNLTEEERNDYEGRGLNPNSVYDPIEINRIANRVEGIENAETPKEIASWIKRPLINFSRKEDAENLTVINAARKRAEELGIDANELLKESTQLLVNEFGVDAPMMIDRIFKSIIDNESKSKEKISLDEGKNPDDVKNTQAEKVSNSTSVETKNDYDSKESEANALKRLADGISELPADQQATEIERRAKEHADSYNEYLKENPVNDETAALPRVAEFEKQTADAMTKFLEKPEEWTGKEENKFENGGRIDENGKMLSEQTYIDLKEHIVKLREDGDTETIDIINKQPAKYYEENKSEFAPEEQESGNPKTKNKTTPTAEDDGSVERTTLTKRAYKGTFRDEVKAELEKFGLRRNVQSQKKASEDAKKIIKKLGLETAYDATLDGDIRGAHAVEIYNAKAIDIENKIANEIDPLKLAQLFKDQAEVIDKYDNFLLEGGQGSSQVAYVLEDSPLGYNSTKKISEWENNFGKKPSAELVETWRERDVELRKLTNKISELEKQKTEIESKYDGVSTKEEVDDLLKKEFEKGKKEGLAGKETQKYTKKAKQVADKFRELKTKPFEFDDGNGNKIVLTQNSIISFNEIIEAGAKIIETTGKIADGINHVINEVKETDWYKNMSPNKRNEFEKKIEEQFGENKPESEKEEKRFSIGNSRVKEIVERRRSENEDTSIDDVVEELNRDFPDKTPRQIRDAITDYGVTKEASAEPDDVTVRRIKRIGRYISALEDIENGIRPERSGQQRDKPDPEERKLLKAIREGIKKLAVTDADLTKKLKSAQDIIETRLTNQIEDLQREIDTKEKTVRIKKDVATTQRIEELKQERDEKKQERDNLFREDLHKDTINELHELAKNNGPSIPNEAVRQGLIRDLIKANIEQGVEQKDQFNKIFEDLKSVFPETTEREVRDAITQKGVFEPESKERDELQKQLSELNTVLNLKNQIEDVQAGITRETKKKGATSEEVKALQKQLSELKKEAINKFPQSSVKDIEKRIERINKSVAEIDRRKNAKEFERVKFVRKQFDENSEWREANKKLIAARIKKFEALEKYDIEFYKNKLENRNKVEVAKDVSLSLWNLPRVALATGEFSFMLVQGGVQTVAHPTYAWQGFKRALKFMVSEKSAEKWLKELKQQEYYPLIKDSKLSITEVSGDITARDELFYSDWTKTIWNTIGSPITLGSKKGYEVWKKANPVQAIERAAVGYLDTVRVMRFLDGVNMLGEKGFSFEANPQEFKDMADVINTLTGRGSIGPLPAELMAKTFFSARNWSSIMKQTLLLPRQLYKWRNKVDGDKGLSVANKIILSDYGKYVGLTTAMMMLAATYFNNDDNEDTEVELDPRSSAFGKIRFGKDYVDPWGGRIQQVVFASRMIMESLHYASNNISKGGYKNSDGAVIPLGTPYKAPSMQGIILGQAINKLNPALDIGQNFAAKIPQADGSYEDEFGQPYTLKGDLAKHTYPIYAGTAYDLLKDDPKALDGLMLFYAYLGGGVQTYDKKQKKP